MTIPIPNTLGICILCFEPVWADSSYLFIKDGHAVHQECYLRQSYAFRQENPLEMSPFKNEWRLGRIAWRCSKCGKWIWLETKIYEKAYKGSEICLDCRSTKVYQDGHNVQL